MLNNYDIIIVIIVVIFLTVFLTFNCVVVFACFYFKHKQSSKMSDGKTSDVLSSQPTQPAYEMVLGHTTTDLEMTENVAYAPVHSMKK